MENYSVVATLRVKDDGFAEKMAAASDSLADFDGVAKSSSKGLLSAATAFGVANKAIDLIAGTIQNSLGKAIKRVDTMNQFPKIMQQIGFSVKDSQASIKKLSDGINGLPTALDDITASTQKLALLTGDLEKATDTSLALNDAFYASGASAEDASRGLIQYTQMLSKGTVDMQSWRTLQETMGVALNDLAASFGFAGESAQNDLYDALKSGEITFTDLNNRLIELDGGVDGFAARAKTASEGIATSFTNLGTAVVRGTANVIDATDKALQENGLPGFQQQIEGVKTVVNDVFNGITEGAGTLVSTVAPAIKFVADNAGVLQAVLIPLGAGFVALKVAEKAASGVKSFGDKSTEAATKIKDLQTNLALAAHATQDKAAADKAAEVSSKLAEKAAQASTEAEKANAAARQLSREATLAKKAADKAGASATKAHADAEKKAASAAKAEESAKKKAEAATKAKERADRAAAQASKKAANAEKSSAAATKVSNTAISTKELLLGVLSGKIKLTTAAQTAWNAAMAANPIGTVITAVTGLITVITTVQSILGKIGEANDSVASKTEKLKKKVDEHLASMKEADTTYKESKREIEAQTSLVNDMADRLDTLANKSKKSEKEKEELSAIIAQLNSQMQGLNLTYDEEEKKLSTSAKAIKNKAKSYESLQKSQLYTERLTKVSENLITVQDDLAEAQDNYNKILADYRKSAKPGTSESTYKPLVDAQEAIDKLSAKEQSYTSEKEQLTERVKNANQQQMESLRESVANQTVTLEELPEAMQNVVSETNKAYQDLYDKATSVFDALSEEQTRSVEDILKTQEKNEQVTRNFGNNMEALRDRMEALGLDTAVLGQFENIGVEAAGDVAALVNGTDEQLARLSQNFANAGDASRQSFIKEVGLKDGEIPEAIQNMMTNVSSSLSESIENADFASLGQNIDAGLATSITDNADQVNTAAEGTVKGARESAGAAAGEGSPCTEWMTLGENMDLGLAQGLTESGASVEAANALADQLLSLVQSAVDKADFSSSFSGMTSAAESGMARMTSSVTAGSAKSAAAMATGMKSMEQKVNTGMGLIKNKTTSGMSGFRAAITVGMNGAKSAAATGTSGVVSVYNNLTSRLYLIGVYAVQGLTDGLNAQAPSAINAARSIANSIATTMSNALKVGSPSKVTTKIGEWAGIGPAIGIKRMLPKVKKVSDRLAEMMVPAVGPDFGGVSQRFAYATNATLTLRQDSGDAGGMLTILKEIRDELADDSGRTYSFVIPVEADGREFARASATYTKAELDKQEKMRKWLGGSK